MGAVAAALTAVGLVISAGPATGMTQQLLVVSAVASSLLLLSMALGIASVTRHPVADTLAWGRPRSSVSASTWTWVILGTLGLSHSLDVSLAALGWRATSALSELEAILHGASGFNLLLCIAAVALGPAIAEEFLFRGVLLEGLRRHLRLPLAIFATSFAFGLIHLELAHGSAAAMMGLYLGVVAVRTGSVAVPIACHFVNNSVAVLGAAWGLDVSGPLVALGVGALAGASFLAGIRALAALDPAEGAADQR